MILPDLSDLCIIVDILSTLPPPTIYVVPPSLYLLWPDWDNWNVQRLSQALTIRILPRIHRICTLCCVICSVCLGKLVQHESVTYNVPPEYGEFGPSSVFLISNGGESLYLFVRGGQYSR
jgi:hypothetical protein